MVSEIKPACLVRIRRLGDSRWIFVRREFDARWTCVSKAVIGRSHYQHLTTRSVGAGDIVVVRDPPSYQPGDSIERAGIRYTVNRNLGDSVEVTVPASRGTLRGGGFLALAAGNIAVIAKSDLVLEEEGDLVPWPNH